MISSGTKRGLAATAVSALAVTGLPFMAGTASAAPLAAQAGGADQVILATQYSGAASTKNDGTNSTISLVAVAGSDVDGVRFEYSLDGTNWEAIETVTTRNGDGAFAAAEWNPGLPPANLQLRAVAIVDGVDGDVDTRNVTLLSGAAAATQTVELNDGPLRVFQQPYGGDNNRHLAVVTGTTSASDGNVTISTRTGVTASSQAPVVAGTPNTFRGVLDISGYTYGDFGTAGNNQIVVGAERVTDDAEAKSIVTQTPTTVTAVAAGDAPAGGSTTVTVTVTDQDGAAIAGAQVYDTNGNRLIGYTDANGQVKDTAAAGGNHTYYANRTSNTALESIDPRDDIAIASYIGVPDDMTVTFRDGKAFDDDEYAAGDIYVTVVDQNDNPVANRTVQYRWNVPGTADDASTAWESATTDAQGRANVVFPVGAASGDYELTYRVPADSNGQGAIAARTETGIKAGQAAIVLTPETGSAAAGGQITYSGTLQLEDGTNLEGRRIDASFARGEEKAPADGVADAGILKGTAIVLSDTYTTDANGAFTVIVKDRSETPAGSELGGVLTAATGNTAATQTSTLAGNAGASDTSKANFTSAASIGNVTLGNASVYAIDGENDATPGRPLVQTITVTSDAGGVPTGIAGKTVDITLPEGAILFEHVNGVPVNEGTVGNGDYKAAANQNSVALAADGTATIVWGYEKFAGFDDDGWVEGTIAVSYAGAADDYTHIFVSGNDTDDYYNPETGEWFYRDVEPLNPGNVDISLAAAAEQESSILPKARADEQTVYFDLVTTDQFGNRTKQYVNLVDGTSPASVSSTDLSQWLGEDPAVEAWSDVATEQTIVARWTAEVNDDDAATGTSTVKVDQAPTITWYEVDFAATASTYTLDDDTQGEAKVGQTVTMKVTAVDQEGQPLRGLTVEFIRSGPNAQSGDINYGTTTNSNGEAFYNFVGDVAGTAQVSAVIRDWDDSQITKLDDSVVFTADTVEPEPTKPLKIVAALKARNNGDQSDVLRVVTNREAAGATVRIYRWNPGQKKKTRIRTGTINQAGKQRFVIPDRNGNKRTKYVAIVLKTDDTTRAKTNKKRVR
ncbi:Ig-like domain-containing protein [Microbacterium sp.]|uniref:Ig-like domain-containing protein n=1 Tax=Microbacterium sp. TaxID=51671 RepID=UPI003736EA19